MLLERRGLDVIAPYVLNAMVGRIESTNFFVSGYSTCENRFDRGYHYVPLEWKADSEDS